MARTVTETPATAAAPATPARYDTIRLTGVQAHGYHGVLQQEQAEGQTFIVDVEMTVDIVAAATHDEVSYTVNYAEVADIVQRILTGQPCELIETVAVRIAEAVLEEQPLVADVSVTVHKPEAPIPADFADVAVIVTRGRQ